MMMVDQTGNYLQYLTGNSGSLYKKAALSVVAIVLFVLTAPAQKISLNGEWEVRLDLAESSTHLIHLPGTLDDAGIGLSTMDTPALNIGTMAHLARKAQYVGKAYYSRDITIPANWKGRHIELSIGRVLWRSQVAIDGVLLDQSGESLVAKQVFDLTGKLIPGRKQRLTITIDNSNVQPGINIYANQYPSEQSREMTHAYTNHTQIKWNGMLGEISLTASPLISIKQVEITPDLKTKKLGLTYQINNGKKETYQLNAFITDPATGRKWTPRLNISSTSKNEISTAIIFDEKINYWNEFTPQRYQLVSVIKSRYGTDTTITDFGIRELSTAQGDLHLNNNRIFIRGNLECVIFPLTGYPPMKTGEWLDLFRKAKLFGLNTFRFHSWCPPEAAFAAADQIGFYLQVELPHWNLTVGKDTAAFSFLRREAFRVLKNYGNHPSFLFFSMGNELEGDFGKLNKLVAELKQKDKRHLYSTTTFTFQKELTGIPEKEDDFFVTQWTKKGWVRGQGVFNDEAPDFSKDFTAASADINVPIISHEIGQYSVYPDLSEIARYKGNLLPLNFVAVKEDLKRKGMLPLAPAFLEASGKFAALLYKEEIERALKTKTFDGFQLLQLQDFPGQGTALVGMLNAFWESKGFIDAKKFHSFNSELTPLIRFPKAVYTNKESFIAGVELANFYQPLNKAAIYWKISTANGSELVAGNFEKNNYPVGNAIPVGQIRFDLANITAASRLVIEVGVEGSSYRNEWNIWAYPAQTTANNGEVVLTSSLKEAIAALEQGQKVLLCPAPDTLKGIEGKFVPVFWSPVHFPDQPGTMGLLVKPTHPALKQFPTENHSDWQWWELVKKSKTLIVDSLPDDALIVRVIDNFMRNKNLSNLFEANVQNGKLLFCSMDIVTDLPNRPQARQLRYSLLNYMNSKDFNPRAKLEAQELMKYFR